MVVMVGLRSVLSVILITRSVMATVGERRHVTMNIRQPSQALLPVHLFDSDADVFIVERKLPHWSQAGAVAFLTWRTHDSMPKDPPFGKGCTTDTTKRQRVFKGLKGGRFSAERSLNQG